MNNRRTIILQPPSYHSQQFKDYCTHNQYLKEEFASYLEFLGDILTRLFRLAKEDELCCLIFPNILITNSELIYSHIISMSVSGNTWGLNDEIILMNKKDKSLGKIAILKKGNQVETISRAERLTYISIPTKEKQSISESVWTINDLHGGSIDEKVIRWLILSYSNANEEIHDPFPEITNSKHICLALGRKFFKSINQ